MADKPDGMADRMLACLGLPDVTAAEKNVLATLAWHDGPGGCYPSMATIAGLTGMHRMTVNKHIRNLEKKGRIVIDNDQRPNRYTINYDPNSVVTGATLIEPEKPAFKRDSVVTGASLNAVTGATQTRRTRRKEEQERPGYQEENTGMIEYEYIEGLGNVPIRMKPTN